MCSAPIGPLVAMGPLVIVSVTGGLAPGQVATGRAQSLPQRTWEPTCRPGT